MADCEKLSTCAFFKVYETEESRQLALRGFIKMFCQGDQQPACLRKKVSQELGGGEYVPINMMPNGAPLTGTNKNAWAPKVIETVTKLKNN